MLRKYPLPAFALALVATKAKAASLLDERTDVQTVNSDDAARIPNVDSTSFAKRMGQIHTKNIARVMAEMTQAQEEQRARASINTGPGRHAFGAYNPWCAVSARASEQWKAAAARLKATRASHVKAIEESPQNAYAYVALASFLYSGYENVETLRTLQETCEDHRRAKAYFELAFALQPQNAELRYLLGCEMVKIKEVKKAEKAFKQAIAVSEKTEKDGLKKRSFRGLGQNELRVPAGSEQNLAWGRRAVRDLVEKIYMRPSGMGALPDFGGYGDARQVLKKRMKSDPKDPYVYFKLGNMEFDLPKKVEYWAKAVSNAVDAEALDALGNRRVLNTHLCLGYARLGEGQKAMQHYKASLGGARQLLIATLQEMGVDEETRTKKSMAAATKVMAAWRAADPEDAAAAQVELDPQQAKDDCATPFSDITGVAKKAIAGVVKKAFRSSRAAQQGPVAETRRKQPVEESDGGATTRI